MLLLPAIDIRDGKAVRLLRGDYAAETRYDDDPVDAALRWQEGGARMIHIVDLDGAREGRPVNVDSVRRIAGNVSIPLQLGGGLRQLDHVSTALENGIERVVLGTAALTDRPFLEAAIDRCREAIVVGVDARGGKVSVAGWTETADLDAAEAVTELAALGIGRFLFTPIEVDGTLEGPNLAELERVAGACERAGSVLLASGGVGSLEDLRALNRRMPSAVEGVVVGRALYEERFTVAEALQALS